MEQIAVQVSELVVAYGLFVAVDHLSFLVKTGEIYGLLGPNGAGKSSTIKVLVGVLEPRSGSTRIFGTPTSDEVAAKGQIGYVPEEVALMDSLTPREFLEFTSSIRRLEKTATNARLERLTTAFELKPYFHHSSFAA
jgi:ABC-2 type transport system ATP-binding protein